MYHFSVGREMLERICRCCTGLLLFFCYDQLNRICLPELIGVNEAYYISVPALILILFPTQITFILEDNVY